MKLLRLVINTESEEPELLGQYMGMGEDEVLYFASTRSDMIYAASADCVAIVEVDLSHLLN